MTSSERTDTDAYFIRDRNRISGPFDMETLRRFAKSQRLARHHRLSTDRMTWVRAVDVLPEVFAAAVRRPNRGSGTPPYGEEDGEENFPLPPQPPAPPGGVESVPKRQTAGVAWGPILAVSTLVLGLAAVGGFVLLIPPIWDTNWSESRILRETTPKLTVVKGTRPDGEKASCFGIVVSRHHVVAPLAAASYRSPKIDSVQDDGVSEWRTATLVIVDADAKLAVLRAELGESVDVITVPEDRRPPRSHDNLYLVAPNRKGVKPVRRATLDEVAKRGEPDESLILSLEDAPPAEGEPTGRAVMDDKGRFVGIVVGTNADGRAMCTAGNEVKIKRTEAKKLPVDHAMAPIDLAVAGVQAASKPGSDSSTTSEPHHKDQATPPVANEDKPPAPPPETMSESAKEPISGRAAEPRDTKPIDSEPPGSEKKPTEKQQPRSSKEPIAAIGEVGSDLLSDVTDTVAPPLTNERASELGRNHLESILREHPRCRDATATARVQRLCAEVLRAAKQDPKTYTIAVVEDSNVNAYAFVGRNVVVTTGFLDFAGRDDDMMRFVLAHEIGHVVLGHTDEPYRRSEAATAMLPGGEIAAGFAQMVFKNSPMNQSQENEADCFAVRCLRGVGRTIDGGIRFFKKVDSDIDEKPSGGTVGALFSSHPETASRIERLSTNCGENEEAKTRPDASPKDRGKR
jgi:hypothetical protein